jgi:L-fuculose-phosphate aldolase
MPPDAEGKLRQAIVKTAQRMSALGLSPGKSGNVSARWRDGMLITASGVAYDAMNARKDVVFVGPEGQPAPGAKTPSTEWYFHKAIYDSRPDIGAVVHCHSRFATALACARKPIPAFHYMVAAAGGSTIPLAPYATFGTPDLAKHVTDALADRDACLLANHGQVAAGADLARALALAEEVEALASQYVVVLTLGAEHILNDAQMSEVRAKFSTYGKQDK